MRLTYKHPAVVFAFLWFFLFGPRKEFAYAEIVNPNDDAISHVENSRENALEEEQKSYDQSIQEPPPPMIPKELPPKKIKAKSKMKRTGALAHRHKRLPASENKKHSKKHKSHKKYHQ